MHGMCTDKRTEHAKRERLFSSGKARTMNNLKPYPAMKDSCVEWLGEMPDNRELRRPGLRKNTSYETYRTYKETRPPEIETNVLKSGYLPDRQIRRLKKAFVDEGGLRKCMPCARINEQNMQKGSGCSAQEKRER